MRRIQMDRFGEADVLHLVEAPEPQPLPHQMVVRVRAAALNPIDFKTRRGLGFVASQIRHKLPWTPGYDMAGEVLQRGAEVKGFRPGDPVCGMVGLPAQAGAYADHIVVEPREVTRVPGGLTFEEAAATPLAALTAWQGLFEVGGLVSGQKVLIHAGAGGVGHFAVQFARLRGAYVLATASGRNRDFLESLGVDEFIDYETEDFRQRCRDLDLVLDAMGGEIGLNSISVIKSEGVVVTVPTVTADAIQQAATAQGRRAQGYTVRPDVTQLDHILKLIEEGQVRVVIEGIYPLERVREAHHLLERGHVRGKLVLRC